jgi:hypothetical protein
MTYLVLCRGLLAKSDDSGHADSQVVSTDVVDLGLLNQRPDLGLLEVLNLVLVGSSKVGAHAAVVASDNNTTLTGRLRLINTVLGVDTGLLASLLEDVTVLVLANAANVDNGLLRKQVLQISLKPSPKPHKGGFQFIPEHHEQCSGRHHRGSAWHHGRGGPRRYPCAVPQQG